MTEKVKSKVLEIMALALEFNGKPTKQECTGNKPTIFVDFAGHVCELDVGIYIWTGGALQPTKMLNGCIWTVRQRLKNSTEH